MKFYFTSNDFLRFCNSLYFYASDSFVNGCHCPRDLDVIDFWLRPSGCSLDYIPPAEDFDDLPFPGIYYHFDFVKVPRRCDFGFRFRVSVEYIEFARDLLFRILRFFPFKSDPFGPDFVYFFDVCHISYLGGPFSCRLGFCDSDFRHPCYFDFIFGRGGVKIFY